MFNLFLAFNDQFKQYYKNTTIITLMFLLYVTHFAQRHSSEIKSIYFTLCFEMAHYQLKTHYHFKKKITHANCARLFHIY